MTHRASGVPWRRSRQLWEGLPSRSEPSGARRRAERSRAEGAEGAEPAASAADPIRGEPRAQRQRARVGRARAAHTQLRLSTQSLADSESVKRAYACGDCCVLVVVVRILVVVRGALYPRAAVNVRRRPDLGPGPARGSARGPVPPRAALWIQ